MNELDSFIPDTAPRIRRIYPHFTPTVTGEMNILLVNLELLALALKGDDTFWAASHADRTDQNFIPGKYHDALAKIHAGMTLEMPWLKFEYGRTSITEGRHRLHALIDECFTHCPVIVDNAHVFAILTLVDKEDLPDVELAGA